MKKIVSIILVLTFILTNIVTVSADAWYDKTVKTWSEKNLLDEGSKMNFRPDDKITRAEFMSFINKSSGFTEKADISLYRDIDIDDKYYDDVAIAIKAGYIKGTSDNTISPNATLTREQAMAMLVRISNVRMDKDTYQLAMDSDKVSDWAKAAVSTSIKEGYIAGYKDGTVKPKNTLTRAEAISIANRKLNDERVLSFASEYDFHDKNINKIKIINDGITIKNAKTKNIEIISDEKSDTTLENVEVNKTLIVDNKTNSSNIRLSGKSRVRDAIVKCNSLLRLDEKSAFEHILAKSEKAISLELEGDFTSLKNESEDLLLGLKGSLKELKSSKKMTVDGEGELGIDKKNSKINVKSKNIEIKKPSIRADKSKKVSEAKPSAGKENKRKSGGKKSNRHENISSETNKREGNKTSSEGSSENSSDAQSDDDSDDSSWTVSISEDKVFSNAVSEYIVKETFKNINDLKTQFDIKFEFRIDPYNQELDKKRFKMIVEEAVDYIEKYHDIMPYEKLEMNTNYDLSTQTVCMTFRIDTYSDSFIFDHLNKIENLPAEKREKIRRANTAIDRMIENLSLEGKSDLEKEDAIIQYMKENYSYYLPGNIEDANHSLVEMIDSKKGVCDAFSGYFYVVGKKVGLHVKEANGIQKEDGIGHAWNQIELNGKWYVVDMTNSQRERKGNLAIDSVYLINTPDSLLTRDYIITKDNGIHCVSTDLQYYYVNNLFFENEQSLMDYIDNLSGEQSQYTFMTNYENDKTDTLEKIGKRLQRKGLEIETCITQSGCWYIKLSQ